MSRPTAWIPKACAGCVTSCAARPPGGRAVLVSSHLLAEVAQTVDHLVVIDRGRLITQAPLAEIMGAHEGAMRVRSPRAAELASLMSDREGATVEATGEDTL